MHAKDIFAQQADANLEAQKIVDGFEIAEGPVYTPEGNLLFSDVNADTIYRFLLFFQKTVVFRQPSHHANGNAYDLQGRLLTCSHDLGVLRTEEDGHITVLVSHYQGKRLNSPDDLTVRRSDGSIYFTDPGYGLAPPMGAEKRTSELGFCGVYRLASNGQLTLLTKDFAAPNGIVFSPDEKQLYICDTKRGNICVFNVCPDGGLESGRLFAQESGFGWNEGQPDGMVVDSQGNLYCSGPGGVLMFSPEGQQLATIRVPEVVTNMAWGGPDRKTLYITARGSIYAIQRSVGGLP
ncbi:MAG: SMP-30/gluconolactonase/LRE family protein [Chroococcidiopsidaceae cyanobacterium CP_BM_ER_R8_30]|nr:SMP-30/gluconolactonase/LRE family protein [Chroococcidiopsidaceae cyanobacterium CP_BM_ER_R8_30]